MPHVINGQMDNKCNLLSKQTKQIYYFRISILTNTVRYIPQMDGSKHYGFKILGIGFKGLRLEFGSSTLEGDHRFGLGVNLG